MILLSRKRSESGTPALRRRRSLTDAVASPHLAELTLAQLRNYRQRLTDEEDRVSYWRRLAHARIDILQAEASTDGTLSMQQLRTEERRVGQGCVSTGRYRWSP